MWEGNGDLEVSNKKGLFSFDFNKETVCLHVNKFPHLFHLLNPSKYPSNPNPKNPTPIFQPILPLNPNKNYCGIIINYLENDFPRKASLPLRLELHHRSLLRPRRSLHRKPLSRPESEHSQEYPSHLSKNSRSVPC